MKRIFVFILVFFNSCAIASNNAINWQAWSKSSFEKAKSLNLPVLINVGHEGCNACRWMKEDTFTDPGIIELVNNNFIAIQVDSLMQPDIGERYSDWAWPATAFTRPDGTQVLAIRGSRKPEGFSEILNRIIKGHKAGTLKSDNLAPYGAPEKPRNTPIKQIRDQIRDRLDYNIDDEKGGWIGHNKILESSEPYLDFAVRAQVENDNLSRKRFIKTANGFIQHVDKVWGGVFYESFGNWDDLILEKRLETQAAALQLFSVAYKLTGDEQFSDALRGIQRYLNSILRSKSGLYFANQQANLPDELNHISLTSYYMLDDKSRRELGMPTIDRSVYTDLNARIISGFVMAYEATGNKDYLLTATNVADALIHTRKIKNNSFIQFKVSEEFRKEERIHKVIEDETAYLSPHAYLGLAFMDLHRATANTYWLKEAEGIITVLKRLHDTKLGGFFGKNNQISPRKPLEDNAVAARFMYLMGVLVKKEEYGVIAERAIRASASKEIVEREGRTAGNLALTTELLTSGYVEYSIIGDAKDPAAQALYDAASDVYESRKVQHYEAPGRYPKGKRAALYICSANACSLPIYHAKDVAVQAKKFMAHSQ